MNEGAYIIIAEMQPSILTIIGELLDLKQTPSQIASGAEIRSCGVFLAGLIEMAADHMQETGARLEVE